MISTLENNSFYIYSWLFVSKFDTLATEITSPQSITKTDGQA